MNGTSATTKVAVVGAGSVGATCAYACLIQGIGRTIALYDINAAKTRAEVLDLNHGLQFVPQATVVGSDDIEVCRGAGLVVVITAGAKQKPGQTRLELAEANVNLSKAMIPRLLEVAPEAILLLAWDVPGRPPLDAAAREDIHRRVVGAAGEIIRGKGATNYAVGLAAARIIEAVLRDQRQVLPSPMSEDEVAGLRRSAETVKGVIKSVGL
jgi:malate/lactate dehydrogenase